jgi:hypothetical protein
VFTHVAQSIAISTGVPQSQVFMGAARQCLEYERIEAIQEAIMNVVEGIEGGDVPACPECGERTRYCTHHEQWECYDPTCEGTVPGEGE